MHIECASNEEMRLICETSTEASQKSLTLLRAIDLTINALVWMEAQAKPALSFLEKEIIALKACQRTSKIDSAGVVCSAATTAEESLTDLYNLLLKKRKAATDASELDGDDKEAIVDAYNHAIAAVADLHNSFSDLRWAIGEHNANLEEPTGKPLSTPEEIAVYLDGL